MKRTVGFHGAYNVLQGLEAILSRQRGICTGELAFSVSPRRVIGGEIFDVMFDSKPESYFRFLAMVEAMTFLHAIKPKLSTQANTLGERQICILMSKVLVQFLAGRCMLASRPHRNRT